VSALLLALGIGMLRTQHTCAPAEVHLWRIELDCAATSVAALKATLSAEELERAARFRSHELCERWTVAHGALRWILATYSQSEPSSLVLRAGPQGKPGLVWPGKNISFNLSHTCGLALLAVAGSGRVGVDAEIVRPGVEVADLSRRFFAPAEADEILGLAPQAQVAAFFACWTRKEAFVKALGTGLSVPMDRFQVTVRADQPARLMSVDWDESDQWTLVDVGEPGVAATLAVEAHSPVLRRLKFTPPFA
jgi:4'-phosphopantetheinyl transferase